MRLPQWLTSRVASSIPLLGEAEVLVLPKPLFAFPTLSDLERKISSLGDEEDAKHHLLEQAECGARFHSSVSLFIGNYTLGKSHNFSYALEQEQPIEPWMVRQLGSFAWAIRHNGERNSPYTLQRCTAAEELQRILEAAPGATDSAARVIGYLDRGSGSISRIFSGFHFFYEHDSQNLRPEILWGSYGSPRREAHALAFLARTAFDSIPESVQHSLLGWIGKYGHEALQGMTQMTIHFKDNRPDQTTITKVLPSMPEAPALGKDTFYRTFGEELVRGYGLIPRA